MFDINTFKKSIQVWTEENPEANRSNFLKYCESLIPVDSFHKYSWLIDQAVMWFENRCLNKKKI